MTKMLLMDEFHLSIYAPRKLPEASYDAIVRILKSAAFRRELRQAVLAVFRGHAALRRTRVIISR